MKEQELINRAVNWWLDRLDGSIDRDMVNLAKSRLQKFSEEDILNFALEMKQDKSKSEEYLSLYSSFMTVKDYEYKKDFYILAEQRRRLEIKLKSLISKDIEKRNISYLYTDDKGFAGGTLALAMNLTSIKQANNNGITMSVLPSSVEMFISRDKVEIRYNEREMYTLCEISEPENC